MAKPFEVGKTYKNGEGDSIRIICIDRKGTRSLIGLKLYKSGKEEVAQYHSDGRCDVGGSNSLDLIPERDLKTAFLVVWESTGVIYTVCSEKGQAEAFIKNNSALVIKEVEYEM